MCALKTPRKSAIDRDGAETLALQALGYLAEEPRRLTRFLGLTGLDPTGLSSAGDDAAVQAAVLEFLLSDESELLTFAGNAGVAPETIVQAHHLLSDARA
jgi:hypothetical protein